MQERENATELFIMSYYSRWGQSISFIKKKKDLNLQPLSWFILFIPTDPQGAKSLTSMVFLWVGIWSASVGDMHRAFEWAQLQNPDIFSLP